MKSFLDACGASGPLLLSVEAPGVSTAETHAFDQPFVLIGRDSRCDLKLNHPEVSDRHAYLQLVRGRLVCVDLGSRNGVYQAGRRVRLTDVERDRSVRIGPYRVRLVSGDTQTAPPAPASPEHVVELTHRGVRPSRCELPAGLGLVGSGGDCPIRLVDPSVSSYHASLVDTGSGVWVVDLLGQGGLCVNDHAVSFAQLEPGDTVELGHSVLRLANPASPPAQPQLVEPPTTPIEVAPAMAAPQPVVATMAAEAPLPITHAAEIVERVLTPVVNQVGLMQQQMVDEFHQARQSMFETFSALHQEQSAFVNQELDRLRLLAQQLHDLRSDLERQTHLLAERLGMMELNPLPTATTVTNVAPSALLNTPPARLGSAASTGPKPSTNGHEANPPLLPRITSLPAGPVGFNGTRERAIELPVINMPERSTDLDVVIPVEASRAALRPERAAATNGSDESIHARLCDRIADIEDAHRSHWQRLLGLFQPRPAGKPSV